MSALFLLSNLCRKVAQIESKNKNKRLKTVRDSHVDTEIQFPESEGHIGSRLDVTTGHALKARVRGIMVISDAPPTEWVIATFLSA